MKKGRGGGWRGEKWVWLIIYVCVLGVLCVVCVCLVGNKGLLFMYMYRYRCICICIGVYFCMKSK